MAAIEFNPTHYSKRAPWGGDTQDGDILVYGQNWSGAAFVWAFAASPGASPLITLTNAAAGSQGVSATYDAAAVHPETGGVVGATLIRPLITETTLEGLTWPSPASSDLKLHHDLLITPVGMHQFVYCAGIITIKPGIGD